MNECNRRLCLAFRAHLDLQPTAQNYQTEEARWRMSSAATRTSQSPTEAPSPTDTLAATETPADSAAVAVPAGPAELRAAVDYADYRLVPARRPWRWVGTVVVALGVAAVVWSLATNPRWEWGVVAQWFTAKSVVNGLVETLKLTAISGALGFGLGIPFTDIRFFEAQTTTLISQFAAAVLGLTLNQAAYSAEIIRGGILSVDQGQLEAAAALGIPARHRATRIVLPQAMRAILPTAFNEVIGLVKGTSIVYVLAYSELFYTVQVIYNRTQQVLPLLLVATLWYVVITSVLSVFQYYIERHYSKGAVRTLPLTPLQKARKFFATHAPVNTKDTVNTTGR